MIIDEIESLRECLNKMVIEPDTCNTEILRVSRELDILLVYYLEQYQAKKR